MHVRAAAYFRRVQDHARCVEVSVFMLSWQSGPDDRRDALHLNFLVV
jgi:hypothetical protein